MVSSIPLIRTIALVPMINWLTARDRPVSGLMKAAHLDADPAFDPMGPIPLFNVINFLREVAQTEGPDIGCRVVSEASIVEIAMLGKVALGTRTPSDALHRIAAALPLFCSHEHLSMEKSGSVTRVRHFYTLKFEAEAQHLIHQYVAAMADRLCSMTGAPAPRLARVEMVPHPEFGVEHLRGWLGNNVVAAKSKTLRIEIDNDVIERPFDRIARDRLAAQRPAGIIPLRQTTLTNSVLIALASMIRCGSMPTIERLAESAGTSVRTLQRRIAAEDTSFSELLDDAKRSEAIGRMMAGGESIGSISAELGYANQSSFTRAMRRWTGKPPTFARERQAG